ncbi:phosphotransferase [Microbacterium murale]|uniref:Aminoglycoside phosphotransferase (APT) family kinase protein n=1 Tax=Microbacterium murale TaxID=1081040 RepID=A0ABU0PE79_9MICO|nr:phosphotransferase [Microbacterium murale]MDQ0644996.1 aminoglycoside phosphotransferase (APT) family kinase protein [Microbacterium murale]
MARSPFTLAAAVTAALSGAEVVGARTLTADGDGRFDSAVVTLADGRELAIRVGDDDETARELAAESLALRALTAGARAMLPFRAPEYIGETRLADGRALVTELLPGFQIEAGHVPGGRGAAESMGASIAAVHALPASVVRGAGLPARSAEESREEIRQLVDRAAATGRIPARLTVRWREAVDDDELWRFESAVTLGGVQATSFLFDDDPERGPAVVGVVHWHGLSLGDPAVDLAWLSSATDAAGDVHAAYAEASDRTPDGALALRARLLAELEFARWLVHGDSLHRKDIMDDAAALLEALAEGLRENDLSVIAQRSEGVDSALDALGRVPETAATRVNTAMETDAYNPQDLLPGDTGEALGGDQTRGGTNDEDAFVGDSTEDLSEITKSDLRPRDDAADSGSEALWTDKTGTDPSAADPADEAQRAARAALQRWTSSSSE